MDEVHLGAARRNVTSSTIYSTKKGGEFVTGYQHHKNSPPDEPGVSGSGNARGE